VTASDPKFFYLHVMKTGGATLRRHIEANFKRSEVYPLKRLDPDLQAANYQIGYLTALPPERRAHIRVFTGHFPLVAVELLGIDVITITILRDPVERTLSYLRHWKRHHEQHRALSIEQIYDDSFQFRSFIKDHQAKLFAMTPDDPCVSYMDFLEVDARRLEIAKANLEKVDVIGLQERFDELLVELGARFGWRFGGIADWHVNRGEDVPASFRRRIADDNQADMAFYEHARRLYERRHGSRGLA
jgi:hypothetical protein